MPLIPPLKIDLPTYPHTNHTYIHTYIPIYLLTYRPTYLPTYRGGMGPASVAFSMMFGEKEMMQEWSTEEEVGR